MTRWFVTPGGVAAHSDRNCRQLADATTVEPVDVENVRRLSRRRCSVCRYDDVPTLEDAAAGGDTDD